LLIAGLVLLVRAWPEPGARAGLALAAAGVGILLALIPSQLNLGVRHALVVYVLLAAAAAVGIVRTIAAMQPRTRTLATVAVAGVLVAQEGVLLAGHPDHIAYFNATAGADPGRILEGADLDWAQGLLELKREALARGIDRLHVAFALGATRACEHGLPSLVALEPHKPVTGWVAVTQRAYSGRREETILRDPCDPRSIRGKQPQLAPGWFRWLHQHQPVWQGSGIRLYYIPPPEVAR
jgi:hypothetical protein